MKNYKEMADDVIHRIDKYEAVHKQKRAMITRTVTSLCCACFIAMLGLGVWQSGLLDAKQPVTLDSPTDIGAKNYDADSKENNVSKLTSDYIVSKELQEQIDKLELQSGDKLGWIVYEGRLYMQLPNIDISNIKPNQYLGRASEFQGAYSKEGSEIDHVDGELYDVNGAPELIFVKLSNGSAVVLSANYLEYYGQ